MSRMHVFPIRRQNGVALLEALIAALLLAIGLLGTIGLQARAYSALSEADMRAEATVAAERLLGLMTIDADNLEDYTSTGATPPALLKEWHEAVVARIPDAKVTIGVTKGLAGAPSEVVIEIGWIRKKGGAENKHSVRAFI